VSGTAAQIAFDGKIVPPPRGQGALVVLPDDAAVVFGMRARVPVRATVNGIRYRGSAMPLGDGRFGLGITKALRAAGLEARLAALAPTHRREYVDWITTAKRDSTRSARVAKAIAMVGEAKALS
jgi:hypothetical protein